MTNIRRYFRKGDITFLTHVTEDRRPLLVDHIQLLRWSIEQHCRRSRFEIMAWSIIPDHWHLVMDPMNNEIPNLMQRIKMSFAAKLEKHTGKSIGHVWQNRYWDHIIRDQDDLNQHIDYIHFNPVKHGLVSAPIQYPHTSFSIFLKEGLYRKDWGVKETPEFDGDFGE